MSKNQSSHASHKDQLTRINRIEGQVRGIKKMVENEEYCVDIITQVKAARSALKSLEHQILDKHSHHCLLGAMSSGNEEEMAEKLEEVLNLIKKYNKS